MATVRRDPESKIFHLWEKVKGPDGKWRPKSRSLHTKDRVTADVACAKYNEDLGRMKNGLVPLHREVSRQKNWWPTFKSHVKNHMAASLSAHSQKKTRFLLGVLEELFRPESLTFDEFKAQDIAQQYIRKRLSGEPLGHPVMTSTVRTEISFISPLFEKAIDEWEWIGITKNPFRKVRVSQREGVPDRKEDPKYLPWEMIVALFAECRRIHGPDFEFMAQFFYYTGSRLDEARRVLVGDFDLNTGTVFIRGTKTEAAKRTIDIPEPFMSRVREVLASRCPGALFTTPYSTIQQRFKRAFRAIGAPWAHVHTLRHCYTSHRLENGDNLTDVRDAVGHKNISTTNIYSHRGTKKQRITLLAPPSAAA